MPGLLETGEGCRICGDVVALGEMERIRVSLSTLFFVGQAGRVAGAPKTTAILGLQSLIKRIIKYVIFVSIFYGESGVRLTLWFTLHLCIFLKNLSSFHVLLDAFVDTFDIVYFLTEHFVLPLYLDLSLE